MMYGYNPYDPEKDKKKQKNVAPAQNAVQGPQVQAPMRPKPVSMRSQSTSAPAAQGAAPATTSPAPGSGTRQKTTTEYYNEYKDHPRTAELIAQEEAKEKSRQRMANVDWEALGRAGYENIVMADEATQAARQAGSDTYDAARRGAGGAGTSYAAMAASHAYNEAYEGVREREAAEAEDLRRNRQSASSFVYTNYSPDDEEYLHRYLIDAGVSEEDAAAIVAEARAGYDSRKATEDSRAHDEALVDLESKFIMSAGSEDDIEELEFLAQTGGISEEELAELYAEYAPAWLEDMMSANTGDPAERLEEWKALAAKAGMDDDSFSALYEQATSDYGEREAEASRVRQQEADAVLFDEYDGTNEASVRRLMAYAGYTDEQIDTSFQNWQTFKSAEISDNTAVLADALQSGNFRDAASAAGYSAEEWATFGDVQRQVYSLMALGDMAIEHGTDSESGKAFASCMQTYIEEECDTVNETWKDSKQKQADVDDRAEWLVSTMGALQEWKEEGAIDRTTYKALVKQVVDGMSRKEYYKAPYDEERNPFIVPTRAYYTGYIDKGNGKGEIYIDGYEVDLEITREVKEAFQNCNNEFKEDAKRKYLFR